MEGISTELMNSLWNLVYSLYESSRDIYWYKVAKYIAQYFRKFPADEVPYRDYDCRNWVKDYFFSLQWPEMYDFIEFVVHNHIGMTKVLSQYGVDNIYHRVKPTEIISIANSILEEELSGYRFVGGVLVPISDKIEGAEIEEAMSKAAKYGLEGAHEHIKTALELMGKKPTPDYRNAIKESISGVESVVKQIVGLSSGGLDDALEELAKNTNVHGALKAGFKKLYGYSSDEDGIRHAILDQSNVGFTESKYMVVACSAFINYLIQKADDAKILRKG